MQEEGAKLRLSWDLRQEAPPATKAAPAREGALSPKADSSSSEEEEESSEEQVDEEVRVLLCQPPMQCTSIRPL